MEFEDACVLLDGREQARCSICNLDFFAKTAKSVKQHLKSRRHKLATKARLPAGQDESTTLKNLPRSTAANRQEQQELELLLDVTGIIGCVSQGIYCTHSQQGSLNYCIPPPLVAKPRLPSDQPFLTLNSGALVQVPGTLEDALGLYCNPGNSRLPNIDIEAHNVKPQSWSQAGKLLQEADRKGSVYWAAFVADLIHPKWWPKANHVPTYDIVIIGHGASGIGLHNDVDNMCGGRPPINTYLTIARGRKRVIMLPPGQDVFPLDVRQPFPSFDDLPLAHRIHAAGGYMFDLTPLEDDTLVTLFIPKGWYHWLIGASDWHVIFGGSFSS